MEDIYMSLKEDAKEARAKKAAEARIPRTTKKTKFVPLSGHDEIRTFRVTFSAYPEDYQCMSNCHFPCQQLFPSYHL